MLRVFFGYDGQVADLKTIVGGKVLQGVLVVLGDLVGDESRHGGKGKKS